MKFLVYQKGTPLPPPTPEQFKATVKALEISTAIFNDLKEKGKIDCVYSLAGNQEGFAIVNADSHEELNEIVSSIPITAYGQIKASPLITMESAVETAKKSLAQMTK